jgi:hypothetical protein
MKGSISTNQFPKQAHARWTFDVLPAISQLDAHVLKYSALVEQAGSSVKS